MNASATTAETALKATIPALSPTGRYTLLVCAFLGWFCAGFHMASTSLAMRPAAVDLLARTGVIHLANYQAWTQRVSDGEKLLPEQQEQLDQWKTAVARWFAWYQCAFLFGAATGGLVFGQLGDRIGRSKAMALSILTYSSLAAASYAATSPVQLLVLWYLACTGVGGMWPNGIALVSEVWAKMSRPFVAGFVGTSANIGIFLLASAAANKPVTAESWRWMMVVAASAFPMGLFVLLAVPESPRWLASRIASGMAVDESRKKATVSKWEIFQPPLLTVTLIGILLATIPLVGAWGSANWMIPWADASSPGSPTLKANVLQARSLPGIIGSLLGGWIGSMLGRRRAYFLVSLGALGVAQYTFRCLTPTAPEFLYWVGALGFLSGIYFGWLPLFLPELFPTRTRSTGAGVSFNFGRIITAITVFLTGVLTVLFEGDYAQIGRVTSLVFALGMVAICFAPDTARKQIQD